MGIFDDRSFFLFFPLVMRRGVGGGAVEGGLFFEYAKIVKYRFFFPFFLFSFLFFSSFFFFLFFSFFFSLPLVLHLECGSGPPHPAAS